jgi:hypothetical protein
MTSPQSPKTRVRQPSQTVARERDRQWPSRVQVPATVAAASRGQETRTLPTTAMSGGSPRGPASRWEQEKLVFAPPLAK